MQPAEKRQGHAWAIGHCSCHSPPSFLLQKCVDVAARYDKMGGHKISSSRVEHNTSDYCLHIAVVFVVKIMCCILSSEEMTGRFELSKKNPTVKFAGFFTNDTAFNELCCRNCCGKGDFRVKLPCRDNVLSSKWKLMWKWISEERREAMREGLLVFSSYLSKK